MLITRPEESYRLWWVVVCDLETSGIGAPYIYDISNLRVNVEELTEVPYELSKLIQSFGDSNLSPVGYRNVATRFGRSHVGVVELLLKQTVAASERNIIILLTLITLDIPVTFLMPVRPCLKRNICIIILYSCSLLCIFLQSVRCIIFFCKDHLLLLLRFLWSLFLI